MTEHLPHGNSVNINFMFEGQNTHSEEERKKVEEDEARRTAQYLKKEKFESYIQYMSFLNLLWIQICMLGMSIVLKCVSPTHYKEVVFYTIIVYIGYHIAMDVLEYKFCRSLLGSKSWQASIVSSIIVIANKLVYLVEVVLLFVLFRSTGQNSYTIGIVLLALHMVVIIVILYFNSGKKKSRVVVYV